MDRVIIVDHLAKQFEVTEKQSGFVGSVSSLISPKKRQVHALRDVSFTVGEGELVGFIGPNGAGKTTTLKTLSGILHPSSGLVHVLGYTPWERKPQFLKKISLVMGQKNQLWWDLPAIETFELLKAIYEIPSGRYKNSLEELVGLLGVEHLLHTQVRKLSLGERMKMELIAALLHKPKVVFLDEPTIGLDVVAQQIIRQFLLDYNKANKATILLTSHNMDDLLDVVKRVIVINAGMIIFDGNFSELIREYAKEKFIKFHTNKVPDKKDIQKIGKVVSLNGNEVTIAVARNVATVAAAEVLQSFAVEDLTIEEEPIDEIVGKVFQTKV
jgi:ABC-2 type transport system ATP-binding protein